MDIQFHNVSKRYRAEQAPAVEDLNLNIENGAFVVLLGPSGSGKSTILNLAAGLEKPDNGEIWGGGKRLNDLEPRERNVAMVFQSYALYPHMNVFENIAFPLSIRKISKEEQAIQVEEAAESLHIGHLLQRRIRELSGGEAQRVALARAIIRRPAVFLMDEPLSNLDAKLRVAMRAEMQRLHRKLQTTIVYVTHDQEEALAIGDMIAIMHNGRLQQYGNPTEIFEEPANSFVASFIGSPEINLLKGQIQCENDRFYFRSEEICFPIPDFINPKLTKLTGQIMDVLIGVRPEDVSVAINETQGSIPATVDVVERIGRDVHAHVNVNHSIIRVIADANLLLKPQQNVWLSFNQKRIHIFDLSTGQRLI